MHRIYGWCVDLRCAESELVGVAAMAKHKLHSTMYISTDMLHNHTHTQANTFNRNMRCPMSWELGGGGCDPHPLPGAQGGNIYRALYVY